MPSEGHFSNTTLQVKPLELGSQISLFTFSDSLKSGRFNRFNNPMVEYEYRKGTYFTVWGERFPNLAPSMIELGRNEYFAKWYKSAAYKVLFRSDFVLYQSTFSVKTSLQPKSLTNSWYTSHVQPTSNVLNLFTVAQFKRTLSAPQLWDIKFSTWKKLKTSLVSRNKSPELNP